MKLVWSQKAIRDLVSIGDYIARNNPLKAREFVELIRGRMRTTTQFPLSGRKVPELFQISIREIIFENYRIVYEIEKKRIVVLTVFEGHRLLKT